MKRLSTGVLAALIVALSGLNAVAASSKTQAPGNSGHKVIADSMAGMPSANFGTPPTGSIPILFNDHHVYTKPDLMKKGRVLAAIVRGGTILVPLRSMFEQMGATVSYNAATKSITVSKPGAEIKLTVGSRVAMINGEERSLDVPPMLYKGSVVVPIRVISESMGAYVQWVPEQKVVVVRYVVPTPAPTEAPATPAPVETPMPTPPPTPTPAPVVHQATQEHFIAGDYIASPKVYNEFSPGNSSKGGSYDFRGAYEFSAFNLPWMIEGDFRSYQYPHNCTSANPAPAGDQCNVTTIGNTGQTYVPAFTARDRDAEVRLGLKVADPRIYIGVGYLYRTTNYGYPAQKGFGFGAEKLPDLNRGFSLYGSAWYYPNVKGNFTDPGTGIGYTLGYNILKYQIGAAITIPKSPIFIDLGFVGDTGRNKSNAPGGFTHAGPYIGLGLSF